MGRRPSRGLRSSWSRRGSPRAGLRRARGRRNGPPGNRRSRPGRRTDVGSPTREPATSRSSAASSSVRRSGCVIVCAPSSQPAASSLRTSDSREAPGSRLSDLEVEDRRPAAPAEDRQRLRGDAAMAVVEREHDRPLRQAATVVPVVPDVGERHRCEALLLEPGHLRLELGGGDVQLRPGRPRRRVGDHVVHQDRDARHHRRPLSCAAEARARCCRGAGPARSPPSGSPSWPRWSGPPLTAHSRPANTARLTQKKLARV